MQIHMLKSYAPRRKWWFIGKPTLRIYLYAIRIHLFKIGVEEFYLPNKQCFKIIHKIIKLILLK